MIFAHASGGFLATYFTREIWGKQLDERKKKLFYLLGTFFGVLLDLDFLYYFFFSAESSHREFVSHTFVFQVLVFILLYAISRALSNVSLRAVSIVYFVAVLSHLVLDSFASGVMWLYPLSTRLFGLLTHGVFDNTFVGENLFLINFSTEALLILISIAVAIKAFFKVPRISLIYFGVGFALLWLSFFFLIYDYTQHVYRVTGNIVYGDIDNDGLTNRDDSDIDGDGVENIVDNDANNNGYSNPEDIKTSLERMKGVNFYPSDGSYYEFTRRLGYFDKKDIVNKALEYAGIYIKDELKKDYKKNALGYQGTPSDSDFDSNLFNIYTYFEKNGMIIKDSTELREGDIIFFGNSKSAPENSGVVYKVNGEESVYYIDKDHNAAAYSLSDIKNWAGEIQGVARLKH
ncbi:metal-dependent hydrolase [Patescibacteria group bacterium]|nr:metal-dependent hydrolase [Patescibacteria group bacterium]